MAFVTQHFMDIWRSGDHIGANRPHIVVEIRRGNWRRDYRPWADPIAATIPGEDDDMPWYPIFTELTPWVEIPNILNFRCEDDFEQNGLSVATIVVDNVGFEPVVGPFGDLYHAISRGYLAPTRGYTPPSRPPSGLAANDWLDVITEQANVRVWQGFGPPERVGADMPEDGGSNGAWVFYGLIDDVTAGARPSTLSVVARQGKLLTDSRVFGWNKSRQLKDPVTFCDRTEAADAPSTRKWILVDDLSDIVRVVLRWAGYQSWEVEDTGVKLSGKIIFNRASYLIDIIKHAVELTGFVFFVTDPVDGSSEGVPVFRRNSALQSPDLVLIEVRDTDMLTDIQDKRSEETLAYIIRWRGKTARDGTALGGDMSLRIMFVYRPPWTEDDSSGGIIKHVTHTENSLRTLMECRIACYLTAINGALRAFTASCEIAGNPAIELDEQVGLLDTATGLNTRLWVSGRSSVYQGGEHTSWSTTLQGALIDSADLLAVIAEIDGTDFSPSQSPITPTSRNTNGRFR